MPAFRLRDGLPVAPGALPLVGHVPYAYRGLPFVLRRAGAEVGPVYWISLGFGQYVLVCTGAEAVEILRSKSFSSGHLQALAPVTVGESLLGRDGEGHRHVRAAMNGPFLPRGLGASTVGARMAERLGALVEPWARGGKVRVAREIHEAALEIILRMIGVEPSLLAEWGARYRTLLLGNLGAKPSFPGSPAWRAARARAWIDARLLENVARVRAAPADGSLLAQLAASRDDDGRPLADGELVDNLRLLVLGGHETISATMAWMVITLGCRPDLWSALCAEAGPDAEVPESPQAARAFPFAEALFRETVRLHPPFGLITRRCEEPFVLHGKTIPRGAVVGVDLWGASRDPAVFPSPDEIMPSRWLGRSAQPAPLELCQFGAGPHFCLGYHLAWLEAVQLAVALARALGRAGRRPVVRGGRMPTPIFVPTQRPPAGTVVEFAL